MNAARMADRVVGGISLRVHFPAAPAAPLPVVVFSHGLGGSRLGYGYLGRFWAEHGFASVHPSHREHVPAGAAEEERPGIEALRAIQQAIGDPANWPARPADLAQVIDRLFELEAAVGALRGKLDHARIAIAGHSYGAYAALLCAGARIHAGGAERAFAEPRGAAFIALSPPGNGARGLHADSWSAIERPVLCITGSRDRGLAGQPPSWREESFLGMRPPDKTLVVIEGAEHFTFSGGRPRRAADPAHLRDIEDATLWFLDRHLRASAAPFPPLRHARVERKWGDAIPPCGSVS